MASAAESFSNKADVHMAPGTESDAQAVRCLAKKNGHFYPRHHHPVIDYVLRVLRRRAETGEIGVVCIKGPTVFKGYVEEAHNQGIWVQGDWFNTGDMGRMDEDGFLWLTGRRKELIIRGGHNIDPAAIDLLVMGELSSVRSRRRGWVLGWGDVGIGGIVR